MERINFNPIKSRGFWSSVLSLVVLAIFFTNADVYNPSVAAQNSKVPAKVLVGAIRWDAWYDGQGGSVQSAVEKSLGPLKYHDRLPFFSQVIDDNTVFIGDRSQQLLDQEINLAADAGIDYWAFVYYSSSNVMSSALSNYLKSSLNSRIGFALIDSVGWGATQTNYKAELDARISLLSNSRYQKLGGTRPIYYMLPIAKSHFTRYWSEDPKLLRDAVSYFRQRSISSGLGNPYIILMDTTDSHSLGVDAVSTYASQGGLSNGTHQQLSNHVKNYWASQARLGLPVVPGITVGWDPRPRVDNPVPWGNSGPSFYQRATPSDIVADIQSGKNWAAAYSKAQESTVIVYAWNEFDEGGWLAPTYRKDSASGDTSRIDALKKMKADLQIQKTTVASDGSYSITYGDGSAQFYKIDGKLYQAKDSNGLYTVFNADYSMKVYGNIVTGANGDTSYSDLSGKIVKVVFKDGSYKNSWEDGWLYFSASAVYVSREVISLDGSSRKYNLSGRLIEVKATDGVITRYDASTGKISRIIFVDGSYKNVWSDGWLYFSAAGKYLFHETVFSDGSYKRYNADGKFYESKDTAGVVTQYNPETGKVSRIIAVDGSYKNTWSDGWLYFSAAGKYLFHEVLFSDGSSKRYNNLGQFYESKNPKGEVTVYSPATGKVVKVIAIDGSYKNVWPDGWLYYSAKGEYLMHEEVLIGGAYLRYNASGKLFESKDARGVITRYNPATGQVIVP